MLVVAYVLDILSTETYIEVSCALREHAGSDSEKDVRNNNRIIRLCYRETICDSRLKIKMASELSYSCTNTHPLLLY